MPTRYQVGDVVRVRENLTRNECYTHVCVVEHMEQYRGTLQTVQKVTERGIYVFEGIPYGWCDEMFESRNHQPLLTRIGGLIKRSDNIQESRRDEYIACLRELESLLKEEEG